MDYREWLEAAAGRQSADLVLKNARILDVYSAEFYEGDIAIEKGRIAGIGDYEGKEEMDLAGRYVVPAFIDGHMHLESAMVTPAQYTRGVLPHGVTTVIADPHEVANVAGPSGIEWLMDAAQGLPLDFRFMIPSCVPSAPIEHSGSDLTVEDMVRLKQRPQAHGLGEMMDFPSLLAGSGTIARKLDAFAGMPRDGHAPGLTGKALNAYVGSGIHTEHECSTREEMEERIRLGMYIQIREGTAAKNAASLLPAVNDRNWRRCFFCTDDIEANDIIKEGTIDAIIRLAIGRGIDPARAYTMASFNAASAYHLTDRGAISPGKRADLLVIDDLGSVDIGLVFAQGVKVFEKGGEIRFPLPKIERPPLSVRIHPIGEEDLALSGSFYNAQVMNPGSLLTDLQSGEITAPDFPYGQGLAKLVNVERHRALPLIGVCALDGFGIKNGAIASTIAHDAHNLLCAGDNDQDILVAIRRAAAIGGGIILASGGQIIGELPLPICGILTDATIEDTAAALDAMAELAHARLQIPQGINPFLSLAFMALPVIPEVKLTVEGLFSVTRQELLPAAY